MRGRVDRMEVLRFMSLNQAQGGFAQILSSAQRAACQKAAGSTKHRGIHHCLSEHRIAITRNRIELFRNSP